MKTILDLLREHPFFAGIDEHYLQLIAGCGDNHVFRAGEYIARENDPADHFYLIRGGRLSIEIFQPSVGAISLQTLHSGDICGWSWLFPPYRWTFDVRAKTTLHAIRLDGLCLRGKCAADTRMGYELMQRFAHIMSERLQAARLQLLDVYSHPHQPLDNTL